MTDPPVWHDESAARHWRSLMAAIAPGVAVALLLQGLLTTSAGVAVLDGSYVTKPGWQQYAALPVWLAAWTLSICAAMLIIRGSLIAAPVGSTFALRAAVRRLGWALGVLVAQGLFTGLLVFFAVLIAGILGPFGIVAVFFAFFIPSATILALPFVVLDGVPTAPAVSRAWELSAGKRWRAFGLFFLVAAPAAAVQWLADVVTRSRPGLVWSVLLNLVVAVAVVILIGFQATVLTRWRLRQEVADGHRYPGSAPRPDQWRLATALIVGAVLAVGAVTWADPLGVPVLASAGAATDRDGGVALTADGRLVPVKENSAALAWAGRGAILPDGRALFASHNNSGPSVDFEICGKESYCDTKLLTTLEKPGLAWLGSAAVAFGDALVIVAVTQHTGMPADRAELVLWRCPTFACDSSRRQVIEPQIAAGSLGDPGFLLKVGQDRRGRPVIAFNESSPAMFAPMTFQPPDRLLQVVTVFRCADADCAQHTWEHPNLMTLVDGLWLAASGVGFDADGRLMAAVVRSPEPPARSGWHIQIGAPPTMGWPVASVVCLDEHCQRRITRRWHDLQLTEGTLEPVALPDGSLILVQQPRFGDGVRLIRCESHCA